MWVLTVLGTCPLGRFGEKEGPEWKIQCLCCQLPGVQPSSPAARGTCLPALPVEEGWSRSQLSGTDTWEGRTGKGGEGLRV